MSHDLGVRRGQMDSACSEHFWALCTSVYLSLFVSTNAAGPPVCPPLSQLHLQAASMGVAWSLYDQASPPKSKWSTSQIPDMSGKVVLITGGNSGLGRLPHAVRVSFAESLI